MNNNNLKRINDPILVKILSKIHPNGIAGVLLPSIVKTPQLHIPIVINGQSIFHFIHIKYLTKMI